MECTPVISIAYRRRLLKSTSRIDATIWLSENDMRLCIGMMVTVRFGISQPLQLHRFSHTLAHRTIRVSAPFIEFTMSALWKKIADVPWMLQQWSMTDFQYSIL